MKDLGIDFGLLIAYLVPGAVGAAALDKLLPAVLQIGTSTRIDRTLLSITIALICGMVISLLRGSIIDPSFRFNFHRLHLFKAKPHYAACDRVEPDYRALAHEGTLGAFREAVLQEKRPYQFYGNTLIATVLWALSLDSAGWRNWLLFGAAWILLYVGARRSHHSYTTAVAALNGLHRAEPRKS